MRLDSSHAIRDLFGARKEKKSKKFKDRSLKKNIMALKKNLGLNWKKIAQRTNSLVNFDIFKKPPHERKQVSRFTTDSGQMVKKTVTKKKDSLNDKRLDFPNGVALLPFSHPNLKEIDDFKPKQGEKSEKLF